MKNKKMILAVVALVVVAAVMMGVYTMTRPETVKGAKEYSVTVIHSEGDQKVFLLDTDAEYLVGSVHCKNPNCITSVEQELEHIFKITDKENNICRCIYCERKELIKEI